MKQIIQNYKGGDVKVEEVPGPEVRPNGVLVKNVKSLISAGTEKMMIDLAQSSMMGKAKKRPDLVKQVLNKVKHEGILNTFQKVMNKLDSPMPLGYSSAGEVIKVGRNVKNIKVGDSVACAGAGYANHAEMVYVPEKLCAKIPEKVDYDEASFTTLGAIALQGIRQVNPKLGDNVVVIGLGLLGQLTIQMLEANGCNVIGIDVDNKMVNFSKEMGFENIFLRNENNIIEKISNITDGNGADSIIITASTSSNDPIEFAGNIARDRAVVSVVGMVNIEIPRN